MSAKFVPFSKSRHAKPNPKLSDRSLNWVITIKKKDREILTTDYSQGIGHCPCEIFTRVTGRDRLTRNTLDYEAAVIQETEQGTCWNGRVIFTVSKPVPPPSIVDVFYCLAFDAEVLTAGSFEEWAADFGYDSDSRSAERTYNACLKIALKLQAEIGANALLQLREAFQ